VKGITVNPKLIIILAALILLSLACAALGGSNTTGSTPTANSTGSEPTVNTTETDSTDGNTASESTATESGPAASITPEEPDTSGSATVPSEIPTDSACYNAFLPINQEVVWRYFSSYTGEAPTEFTIAITDVTDEGVTSTMTFPEFSSTVHWHCGPDGLFSSEFAQFTIAMMPGTQFETLSYEGVTLPAENLWTVGYTWSSGYEIKAHLVIEGTGMSSTATATFSNRIIAIEEVTVPAGTYPDAYRVETSGTLSLNLAGMTIDSPIETTTWYVKNVGMVKSVSVDEAGTSSIELTAIE
jgi:hypothetical protein